MRMPAIIATLYILAAVRESTEGIVAGGDEEIAGRTLIPITAMVNGYPQSTTYFDRSTALIAKTTKYYVPDVRELPKSLKNDASVETETEYSDYKDFEGVTLPTRMVVSQAGKTLFDVSVLQVEFPSKFDTHLFDKPQDE